MCRKLTSEFIKDLNGGILKDCLNYVQRNKELILEIRKKYINIYYKGGNVFRISPARQGYRFFWDTEYLNKIEEKVEFDKERWKKLRNVMDRKSCMDCVETIPKILNIMNIYFKNKPKREKFIQQEVVKTKLLSGYILTDFEYQKGNRARFDLMGVKCHGSKPILSYIELKEGYKSLRTMPYMYKGKEKQTSGLKKHLEDILDELKSISSEVKQSKMIFEQKKSLGFLSDKDFPEKVSLDEIEVLFVVANYMTRGGRRYSSNLRKEVDLIENFLVEKSIPYKLQINMMYIEADTNGKLIDKSKIVNYSEWEELLSDFYDL